jgi:hypothetical protein
MNANAVALSMNSRAAVRSLEAETELTARFIWRALDRKDPPYAENYY